MKIIKYRIVEDLYAGYEVQIWRLWFPFWIQKNVTNTYSTLEKAKKAIQLYKRKVVVYSE